MDLETISGNSNRSAAANGWFPSLAMSPAMPKSPATLFQLAKDWLERKKDKDGSSTPSFNPEPLTNQKREWVYMQRERGESSCELSLDLEMFEHFVVVGLQPNADVSPTVDAFKAMSHNERVAAAKKRFSEPENVKGYPLPSYEPKVLFKYPPAKRLSVKDLSAFCFPNGIQAKVVTRTQSMSDFNQVIYGQDNEKSDDQSFIFLLKVANNVTLYGVCVVVMEILQRPPGFTAMNTVLYPNSPSTCQQGGLLVVKAPRCYCLLTRHPFFNLHFEVLNNIIASERYERVKDFMSFSFPRPERNLPDPEAGKEWWRDGLPVKYLRPSPLDSTRHPSRQKSILDSLDSLNSDIMAARSSQASASSDLPPVLVQPDDVAAEDDVLLEDLYESGSESGSDGSDESECQTVSIADDLGVSATKFWAEVNDSNALRVVCAYHSLPVLPMGDTVLFRPLDECEPVSFLRADLPLNYTMTQTIPEYEAMHYLGPWTIAALCRTFSLDNILLYLQAALLEKQMIVICPNPATLSAIVSSVVPLLQPFLWQSVLLPILPTDLLAFMDAPVPFVVGALHKTSDVRQKSSNLIRVNAYKDKIKLRSSLPPLPNIARLHSTLLPIYRQLSESSTAKTRPVYRLSEVETKLSEQFLSVTRQFLEDLCCNLRLHAITDVRPGNRVSLLLKDSFLDSFPSKERSFMKVFCETQLFSVYSDMVLSSS